MAKLTIDTGTAGNTATGDSIRSAFTKVNANFTEIYNELGSSGILSDLSFAGNTISTDNTNQNIILSPNGTGLIDVDSRRIINVSDPTSAQDAATKNYVDTQLSNSSHNITFVGDDSTGTAVTQGETFKFAGTQNITTAVSGDTLTITGPDLTAHVTLTGSQILTNKTITLGSNTVSGTLAQFNTGLVDGDFATESFVTSYVDARKEASFSVRTADFNAVSGQRYGVDTSSNTVTATLPGSPSTGDAIYFADAGGAFATNNLTIGRNGNTIMGLSSDMTISTNNSSTGLFYNGSTWRIY